jgi:hypothetical protein
MRKPWRTVILATLIARRPNRVDARHVGQPADCTHHRQGFGLRYHGDHVAAGHSPGRDRHAGFHASEQVPVYCIRYCASSPVSQVQAPTHTHTHTRAAIGEPNTSGGRLGAGSAA